MWPHGRFQILALDGGGLKGLFSAAVLAAFEEDLGTTVADNFDLITGTSTGGLIALGMGAGISLNELVEMYVTLGPSVFKNKFRLGSLRHFVTTKYSVADLRRALEDVFGQRRMSESAKRLVIPAYNLRDADVYIFKTPHHGRLQRDWRESMVDVALATTAAPTFLPAHALRNTRLIDGGVWSNNPVLVGVAEAISLLNVPLDSIHVLSIGTTRDLREVPKRLDRGGISAWLRHRRAAADVILGAQSSGVNGLARHFLTDGRFLRLDPVVPAGMFQLDRIDGETLRGKAEVESRKLSPEFDARFRPHKASEYIPIYPEKREEASDAGNA